MNLSMRAYGVIGIGLVMVGVLTARGAGAEGASPTAEDLRVAGRVLGLDFTEKESTQMLGTVRRGWAIQSDLRSKLPDETEGSALGFDPRPMGFEMPKAGGGFQWRPRAGVERPGRDEDLCFLPVADLAALLREGRVTSVELTRLCLDRLKRHGPALRCVVGLTEKRAMASAERADGEIRLGRWRGPLHGIPYGAKDLLDVAGEPATWGVSLRTNTVAKADAEVIQRLEAAGAVLVARLSLGELAMGDVWFGGTTRNPWKPKSGSSGSSAGSASAVAAGLVPFAIGSETLGSIVSPSTVCGVTGLRPTFGRVSRAGAMTLCYSMDKLGPITRAAEDCALVFATIAGGAGRDPSVIESSFDYPVELGRKLRVGYLEGDFGKSYANRKNDAAVLEWLKGQGHELRAVTLPQCADGAMFQILNVEAAASFDELTRSNQDDRLVQQGDGSWPNLFRSARLVSAVDYLQANRVRSRLIREMHGVMESVDVLVAPSFQGRQLLLSNMTGHPCVVVPNGDRPGENGASVCFLGRLFGEAQILSLAQAYQKATGWHLQRPDLTRLSEVLDPK